MNSPCRVGQNFLKTLMSKEVPDPNAPTKTSLSLILAAKLPGNPLVSDTRWPAHLFPLFVCDLTHHLAKTGADPRAPPGMLLEVIPRPNSNI